MGTNEAQEQPNLHRGVICKDTTELEIDIVRYDSPGYIEELPEMPVNS